LKSTFGYYPILDLTAKRNLALAVLTRDKRDGKGLPGLQGF
jgi:hypothetical protein